MNIPNGSSWDAIIRCLYYGETKIDRGIGYGESQFGLFKWFTQAQSPSNS